MKIRTFYSIENGVYKVSIFTEDWSERDIRLMQRFGEPEINIGGTLSIPNPNSSEDDIQMVIEDSYRRIRSGSPITKCFDSRDSIYARDFAELWADETRGAISAAYTTLHDHSDDFTREVVHTLSSI